MSGIRSPCDCSSPCQSKTRESKPIGTAQIFKYSSYVTFYDTRTVELIENFGLLDMSGSIRRLHRAPRLRVGGVIPSVPDLAAGHGEERSGDQAGLDQPIAGTSNPYADTISARKQGSELLLSTKQTCENSVHVQTTLRRMLSQTGVAYRPVGCQETPRSRRGESCDFPTPGILCLPESLVA